MKQRQKLQVLRLVSIEYHGYLVQLLTLINVVVLLLGSLSTFNRSTTLSRDSTTLCRGSTAFGLVVLDSVDGLLNEVHDEILVLLVGIGL